MTDMLTDGVAGLNRKIHTLTGPCVRPITRDLFPVGQPVVVEAIIDRKSGWEFDAPLHIMAPFHRYCETGSIGPEAVERRLEDIMIDLDIGLTIPANGEAWPYSGAYLRRAFAAIRRGQRRKRWSYYRSTVIVTAWGDEAAGIECVQYTVETAVNP